ncbi:MAG: diacylglycerol kinase [Armatimonadota bacterium]|nr:diacylglycerol kinase [Armatimonadota bacterium]
MLKKSIFYSVGHAVDGLVHCLRTQRHMRNHFGVAFLVVVGAALLHVEDAPLLALLFSVTVVLVAEMFNTAIEVAVDMIKPTYDPRAKIIKDVAAGAVLLSGLSSAIIGALVYLHSPVVNTWRQHIRYPRYSSSWPELAVEAMLILLILVVAWKVKGGNGSILYDSPISGRAAFGFFCMVLILANPDDEVRVISTICMGVLVMISRSATRRQTVRQVLLGAALGIIVPGAVFAIDYAFIQPRENPFHSVPSASVKIDGPEQPAPTTGGTAERS